MTYNGHDDVSSLADKSAEVVTNVTTVETATLVLPEDTLIRHGDELILQTTREIAATMDMPGLQSGLAIHIEGIVDLDGLREMVPGVDQDEFASLLHTRQHNNDDDEEEDNTTLLSTILHHDEQTNLLGDFESEDVPVAADAFLETLANTMSPTKVSSANKTRTFETSNQGFLLSVPLPTAATDGESQTLVLALPKVPELEPLDSIDETKVLPGDAHLGREGDTDEAEDDEYHGFVEIVRQYSEYLPHIPALPTDVQDVELLATTTTTEQASSTASHTPGAVSGTSEQEKITQLDLIVERRVPLIGYVILVVGLFALSSVGAALNLQQGDITPTMKTHWRLQATSICFLPLAVVSLAQTPKEKLQDQWASLTNRDLFVLMPLCAASYAFMTAAFVVALEMTSLANAFILSNLASLVIICGKFILGIHILLLQGTGAFIGLSGAVVCALAPPAATTNETLRLLNSLSSNREQHGDFIAFLSSLGTALYLILAKNLRYKMDLFLFMFMLFSLASIVLLCYMIMVGEEVEFSMDPNVGIFGWMNLVPDRLPLELYLVFVCNLLGTTGYIAVMKYFDPVVISMVMLTEPVIATFLGIIARVATMPVRQIIVGNVFVVLGSTIVIASESKKTESIDATKALKTVEDTRNAAAVLSPQANASGKRAKSRSKIIWKPS